MSSFPSAKKGRTIELYYEEFVKLSRYAPLMTKEQKLSRFILGLGMDLSNEFDALQFNRCPYQGQGQIK